VSSYRVETLTWPEARRDEKLVEAWEACLQRIPHPLMASPEWVDHLATTRASAIALLVVRCVDGRIAGVVPAARHRVFLRRESRSHGAATSKLAVASILGSVPPVPEDGGLVLEIVAGALAAFPDCDAVYFDALPLDSRCLRLFDRRAPARSFLPYRPYPDRAAHSLELGASLEDFLGQKTAKSRYKLRRVLAELDQRGTVEVACYRSSEQVDGFVREAAEVQRRSWQHADVPELLGDEARTRRELHDLARRGLLRSYLLRCGDAPCAFVIGFQGRGIYHYWEVGYDADFAEHSPGMVLLYRLLEDLFLVDRPKLVDFGKGDDGYKRRFATHSTAVTSILLLRPTLWNAVRIRAHEVFVKLVRLSDTLRRARLGHGS
jgi:CelD/BcsL family acetyltransferase involved in cellulose biosynthesis